MAFFPGRRKAKKVRREPGSGDFPAWGPGKLAEDFRPGSSKDDPREPGEPFSRLPVRYGSPDGRGLGQRPVGVVFSWGLGQVGHVINMLMTCAGGLVRSKMT